MVSAAREAGAQIIAAEHPTTTLEDLFLRVVGAEARDSDEPASPGADA